MEINITIAGEELNDKRAAKQLHQIADMVRSGIVTGQGFSIDYVGEYSFDVDFESDGKVHHVDFLDGEGNHIHVDEDGIVVFRRTPESDDVENLLDQHITVAEWSAAHGGITPLPDEGAPAGG